MTTFKVNGETMVVIPLTEYERLIDSVGRLVTRKDICQMYGVAKSTLSESPWLLPNYGRDAKGKRGYKWIEHEVIEWMKTPVTEHKEKYLAGNY